MAPLLRDLAVSGELTPELADRSWDDGQDVVSGFNFDLAPRLTEAIEK